MVARSGRSLKGARDQGAKGQSRMRRQVLLLSLLMLPVVPTAAIAEVIDSSSSTTRSPATTVENATFEVSDLVSDRLVVPVESPAIAENVVVDAVPIPTTADTSISDPAIATPNTAEPSSTPANPNTPEPSTAASRISAEPAQAEPPTSDPAESPPKTSNSDNSVEPESKPELESEPKTDEASETEPSDSDSEKAEKPPTPEEQARQQKLIEADQLYLGGQFPAAEKLYREAKTPFAKEVAATEAKQRPEPILDPAQLSPAGRVYWRESEAGMAQNLKTRIFVPLSMLVEQHPQFVPGHLRLAQALKDDQRTPEALTVLERATAFYPNQPDLLKAKIELLAETEQWLDASIAARQFALLNPNDPAAPEFAKLAEENLERFRVHMRRELRGNAIANAITGVAGLVLTGNPFSPLSAVQTTAMLMRGEAAIGESVAKDAKEELELIDDPLVVDYVNEIGRRIATVAGRDFKYEFHVIMDDRLNAFALPGGKVFLNAGAIAKTNSEAELAGLLAHELSHSVLSHGFQLVAQGNLISSATQFFPFGGTIGNLAVLDYSRDMERQADIVGTRILASTGYAADGLRNLMVTLDKEDKDRMPFSWLSSHPITNERVEYLETLIQENGYNRYAYEGVTRHNAVKARVKQLIAERKQCEKENEKKDRRDRQECRKKPEQKEQK
ncbi:M48 family metalloprotease [Trichocoleus desertorum]